MTLSVDRLRPLFPVEHILVVTSAEYAGILGDEVPDLPGENFIAEPEGCGINRKNSVYAVAQRRAVNCEV